MDSWNLTLKSLLFKIYLSLPFTALFFRAIKGIGVPPYHIRKYLRFNGVFNLPIAEKTSIKLRHFGNTIENELFWLGLAGWESESLKLWMKLCRTSSVVLDVGANNGLYSIVASKVNPNSSIHAFEPIDYLCKHLRENCALNGSRINVHPMALSNSIEDGIVYVSKTVSATFDQASLEHPGKPGMISLPIRKTTLSAFIEQNTLKNIDLMKIDVERHEPKVVAGMGSYLAAYRPSMLIEILNDEVGDAIHKMIENLDYEVFGIDEKRGPIRISRFKDYGKAGNYLLLNRAKHGDIM